MRGPGRQPVGGSLTRVSSAPVDDGRPLAAHVRDPALTGLQGAGIVVSCAQGALGLLPFAVRLGDLLVAGVRLLVTARDVSGRRRRRVARGNRVRSDIGPVPGRATRPTAGAGRYVAAGVGKSSSRTGTQVRQQSTTFESTTQRR